jgi:hypothetical protein
MRITTKMWILTGVLLLARMGFAQTERESPNGFYRLEFVTKELDETKVVMSRNYSMTVSDKATGQIRTGSRVPSPTSTGGGNTQFTYIDLGVSIDCREVHEVSGQLTLSVTVDLSSASADTAAVSGAPPVVRQYKWSSGVIVPLRKSTQIYSSDDLASKRKFQIELTATPIK